MNVVDTRVRRARCPRSPPGTTAPARSRPFARGSGPRPGEARRACRPAKGPPPFPSEPPVRPARCLRWRIARAIARRWPRARGSSRRALPPPRCRRPPPGSRPWWWPEQAPWTNVGRRRRAPTARRSFAGGSDRLRRSTSHRRARRTRTAPGRRCSRPA